MHWKLHKTILFSNKTKLKKASYQRGLSDFMNLRVENQMAVSFSKFQITIENVQKLLCQKVHSRLLQITT